MMAASQTLGEAMAGAAQAALPAFFAPLIFLIPFIVMEQLRPAVRRPRAGDYGFNILISVTAIVVAIPVGVFAGIASAWIGHHLPWHRLAFPFLDSQAGGLLGGIAEVLSLIFVPLLIHDCWFYWSHRLEHKIGPLWEFHKLHHGDRAMNCTAFARDHFLQNTWRAFFSIFTAGLIFDLPAIDAGRAAAYSGLFFMCLSMFYHSAIRVELPYLDRVFVTPQVHRIHHSLDSRHFNRNFADIFPLFDIVFGTFQKPQPGQFEETGLPDGELGSHRIVPAMIDPVSRGWARLFGRG